MMSIKREHLIRAARKPDDLLQEVAFVGGAVLATYLPQELKAAVRPAYDIDVVIGITHYGKIDALNKRLHQKGFSPDPESPHISRYTDGELLLDIMPSNPEVLGFFYQWYEEPVCHICTLRFGMSLQ